MSLVCAGETSTGMSMPGSEGKVVEGLRYLGRLFGRTGVVDVNLMWNQWLKGTSNVRQCRNSPTDEELGPCVWPCV